MRNLFVLTIIAAFGFTMLGIAGDADARRFGGAFEGINFFDILMIGGGLMLLFWFMRRKTQPMAYASPQGYSSQPHSNGDADIHSPQGEQITGGKMLRPEVNEIWIFQHNPQSEDPTWYLAGIQQVN